MAKYTRAEGTRGITGEDGYGWLPVDGAWVRADHDEPTYTLEKRRRSPKDGTHTTGWYLYDDASGGFFGEFTSSRILEAVDLANDMIARAEKAESYEVTPPAEPDDEDAWDEPRAELEPAEVMTLRPGLVVEARTAPGAARVRVRLAATPTNPAPGIVTLKGADDTEYDVDATSVVLIGVMPRKGDTIHAQAKAYTTAKTAAELPDGARVRASAGKHEGRSGKVIAAWAGRVDKPGHPNHGREYVGVQFDGVPGDGGANRHFRPFVDELRLVGISKPMRRKLDRDPWAGGPGNTVVSDGRGVEAVLTSSIVILAAPGERTDEQRIARAISLAMPGLDFHTNTTSLAAIRVFAKRAEHEGRDDEAVLARNDDIAEALLAAGVYVARRGVGQAVYAEVDRSGRMSNRGVCELEDHQGPAAPWVAVVTGKHSLDMPHACRACVRRLIESERALEHADPERPYLVRMWDEQGRTLKLADDPQALDFTGAATETEARTIAEDIVTAGVGRGWLHRDSGRLLVDVARVTIDRALFYRDGELRNVEGILDRSVRAGA